VESVPAYGLTLGIADLLDATDILLLASGAKKADIVAKALEGTVTEALPASALQGHPSLTVLIDSSAASRLRKP
jgi:glucosamine-6-phosphate deaminase